MNSDKNMTEQDEMRSGYDFSDGVRGKHFKAYRQGTNLIKGVRTIFEVK